MSRRIFCYYLAFIAWVFLIPLLIKWNVAHAEWTLENQSTFCQSCAHPQAGYQKFEHIWGSRQASVFLVVYSSLSCQVCGDFYFQVLQKIRDQYHNNPDLCILFKDYPTDGPSFRASLLVWGGHADQSLKLHEAFYNSQKQWAHSCPSWIEDLKKAAIDAGLSSTSINQYWHDSTLAKNIIRFRDAEEALTTIETVPLVLLVCVPLKRVKKLNLPAGPSGLSFLKQSLELFMQSCSPKKL